MADLDGPDVPEPSPTRSFGIADPGPLGLAAFALTTFLLSIFNAGWTTSSAWLPYALAYGGLVQLLAGMWEFRRDNTFGATAFGTYGAFWLGLWFYFTKVATPKTIPHDLALILLAFAIFNTVLLICAAKVNMAVFAVFLTLEVTEILLAIGNHAGNTNIIKAGGIVGVITAAAAWYASFAGVFNSLAGRSSLPVGKPLDF
jgi:uncharacterized protein